MKKIIIIGTRRRDTNKDYKKVWNEFRKHYDVGDIIVSGGCQRGGDRFAELIASRLNLTEKNGKLIIHRPVGYRKRMSYWEALKALMDRNTLVAEESDHDTVIIACVAKNRKGGTEDTLTKIYKRNNTFGVISFV